MKTKTAKTAKKADRTPTAPAAHRTVLVLTAAGKRRFQREPIPDAAP